MQALSCSRIASADPAVYIVISKPFLGGVAARRLGLQCGRSSGCSVGADGGEPAGAV